MKRFFFIAVCLLILVGSILGSLLFASCTSTTTLDAGVPPKPLLQLTEVQEPHATLMTVNSDNTISFMGANGTMETHPCSSRIVSSVAAIINMKQ